MQKKLEDLSEKYDKDIYGSLTNNYRYLGDKNINATRAKINLGFLLPYHIDINDDMPEFVTI